MHSTNQIISWKSLLTTITKDSLNMSPLSLQDLCLLVVINDLDSYPTELLSSLPYWLRHYLLNNLPVLDLCRLDNTDVAKGVGVDEIWKSIVTPSIFYDENNPRQVPSCIPAGERVCVPLANAPFLMEPWVRHGTWYLGRYIVRLADIPDLNPDLAIAFQGIPVQFKRSEYSIVKYGSFLLTNNSRERCLLKAAIHLLDRLDLMDKTSESYVKECTSVFDWLISVRNCSFLSFNNENKEMGDQQWTSQSTALAMYQGAYGEVRLAPHRLLPIHTREDVLELFTVLTRKCNVRPSELAVNCMHLAKSMQKQFPDEERHGRFKHLLKEFLQNVVVLGLWGRMSKFNNTMIDDICKTIIEGAVGDGSKCRLSVLYCREVTKEDGVSIVETLSPSVCALPSDPGCPRYTGLSAFELFSPVNLRGLLPYLEAFFQQQLSLKVVRLHLSALGNDASDIHKLFGTLSSLFSRPAFQALSIRLDVCVDTKSSLLLLKGFLSASCPHVQQLTYDMARSRSSQFVMSVSEMASLIPHKRDGVSSCAIEHKTLLSRTHDVFRTLLLFPTVRLRDLDLCDANGSLHMFAQHPDLQVSKLRLNLLSGTLSETTCDDIVIFLKMSTLTELTVFGGWTESVLSALAHELATHVKVGSLRSISLCTSSVSSPIQCSGNEFQLLWDALFSLPQLSDLELVISGDEMLKAVNRYEQLVYDSWRHSAFGKQVKVIKCSGSEVDSNLEFGLLNKVAETICRIAL